MNPFTRFLGRARPLRRNAGLSVTREFLGGMNVSFLGEMPEAKHLEPFRKAVESIGEKFPGIAEQIDRVQIVNSSRFTERATGQGWSGFAQVAQAPRTRQAAIAAGESPVMRAVGRRATNRITIDYRRLMGMAERGDEAWSGSSRIRVTGDEALADLFHHEFGHQWHAAIDKPGYLGKTISPQLGGALQSAYKIGPEGTWGDAGGQAAQQAIAGQMGSRYARRSSNELIAENFLAAQQGDVKARRVVEALDAPKPLGNRRRQAMPRPAPVMRPRRPSLAALRERASQIVRRGQ